MARPRSSSAHAAVLKAACALFADRGIDATSMDAIASTSGVSKATIYKHWEDKDTLCLEVMAYLHGTDTELPDTNTGDLRADLLAVMLREPPKELASARERLMPQLMAIAGRNPRLGAAWRARVFDPPRQQITRALHRAIARGELPAALDLNLAIAVLLGPPLYLHIRKLSTGEAPAGGPEYFVDAFLRSQGHVRHPSTPARPARMRTPVRRTGARARPARSH